MKQSGVEVIERWVAGGATEYSVDGGKVWWTKEQFKAAQEYRTQYIATILERVEREVIGPDGEVTGHTRPQGYLSVDLTQSYYNQLRQQQRSALKTLKEELGASSRINPSVRTDTNSRRGEPSA